jgi:hypothetical protein
MVEFRYEILIYYLKIINIINIINYIHKKPLNFIRRINSSNDNCVSNFVFIIV